MAQLYAREAVTDMGLHIEVNMIMASHQTFSSQLWHFIDQLNDQTNSLYIINGGRQ